MTYITIQLDDKDRTQINTSLSNAMNEIEYYYEIIRHLSNNFVKNYNPLVDDVRVKAREWIDRQPKKTSDGIIIKYIIVDKSYKFPSEYTYIDRGICSPRIQIKKTYKFSKSSPEFDTLAGARAARKRNKNTSTLCPKNQYNKILKELKDLKYKLRNTK